MEWLSVQAIGGSNAALSVICCVTLSKLLTVSALLFYHVKWGKRIIVASQAGVNELVSVRSWSVLNCGEKPSCRNTSGIKEIMLIRIGRLLHKNEAMGFRQL